MINRKLCELRRYIAVEAGNTGTVQQKERSEIPDEAKWNLTVLYSSEEEWEKDFNSLGSLLESFNEMKGKLDESPAALKKAYERSDAMMRVLEKVYVYAHLKSDEDVSDSHNSGNINRISAKYAEIQGASAWFEPEILAIPEDKLALYLESDELAFYRRSLKEVLRDKPHTLSAPEEKILGMASDALSMPEKIFSALNNADIPFPAVADERGRSVELTHGNYTRFLESGNREIRKNAFNAMYDTFAKYRNTLAATLHGGVKTNILNATLRSFPSALDAALHPDNVPRSIYENLIETVSDNLVCFHDYLELRRKTLQLDSIDMYDLHTPMVKGDRISFLWEDACKKVIKSVDLLGNEYVDEVKKGFERHWFDIYESRGKRSGAYSSGCYDSYPYILMNFNGTLSEVFTLAHELGHSMHSLLSRKNQAYHYADYKIFVAEVASTTNELLLHHYLLNNTDDENFKLHLLNHLADEIRGTVFRQTMFAEFEKLIYESCESGEPLTPDGLSESYYNLNRKYHGGNVVPDRKIEMEWARIPHFYYNFYVYKYATGFSAAAALSKGIISGDRTKTDAYLNFLKAGSTKDVLDIMKDAGVDLTVSAPVEATMELFSETVKALDEQI